MKITLMVRQLDLGHILWCGRVVRVERAHRVRVVRGVQMGPGRLMALVLRVTTCGVTRWRCASPRSPRSWPMPRRACATTTSTTTARRCSATRANWARRHRLEAEGFVLSQRSLRRLAENEEPGVRGGDAGGGRGLGPPLTVPTRQSKGCCTRTNGHAAGLLSLET